MATQQIPLIAAPSQTLTVRINQQTCRLVIYQKRTGLYLDAYVADVLVAAGILCRDRVFLVRGLPGAFPGDLAFIDTQGASDPEYTGLAGRFQLLWIG